MGTKNIIVRGIPEHTKKKLDILCKIEGKSLNAKMLELIIEHLRPQWDKIPTSLGE